MRKARHHPIRARLGLREQGFLQGGHAFDRCVQLIAHPKLEIGRDLIVARPARVQTPSRFTYDLFAARFDIHVNVFERGGKREVSAFNL